jgi:anti-sigma-K factor RskA
MLGKPIGEMTAQELITLRERISDELVSRDTCERKAKRLDQEPKAWQIVVAAVVAILALVVAATWSGLIV